MPEGPFGVPRPLAEDQHGMNIILGVPSGDSKSVARRLHRLMSNAFSSANGVVVTGYREMEAQSAGYTSSPAVSIGNIMSELYGDEEIARQNIRINMVEMVGTDVPSEIIKDYPEDKTFISRR